MANKQDRFYFENFISAADCCCKAADYLVACLQNYDPAQIKFMLDSMHAYEHMADMKKHEMSNALAKAFVTPLDREDLAAVSQNIDEVVDCVEEVLQRFYINDIRKVSEDAVKFARKIADCTKLMKKMLEAFENYRKYDALHTMIVDLNHLEEECDRLYMEAARKIRLHSGDALEIIAWREIYDYMEKCSDACEHVADSVETVVMKNT